ncbi:MAG: sulfite exporter TauE/SafE family protein [Synechococcales cyanobacterium K44_A2020_017]|nr:sulfite exporter TauE/SafE family protein [Synechococcales cyanobacterium K32_A2020_035]MBF2095002.1 sulfite exporter TauE/SafE family protein [Synechococcales cyanobacterium K44_A2020_017]
MHKTRSLLAFLWAVPISLLGGLMGLGGAEFRLPVLAGPLGYRAKQAVPVNLAVSLVTITVALLIRGQTLSLDALVGFQPVLISLIVGAAITAYLGASWVRHISNERLERVILVLLVSIGIALLIEAFLPEAFPGFVPAVLAWQIPVGVLFGLGIGLVSSILGVAGGELIIPTLIFAFGVDIKSAGTGSLIVSLPTVTIGLIRYIRAGALSDRQALRDTVVPIGIGSVIGAIAGGLLVGLIAPSVLKFILGFILIVSAVRVFAHTHKSA